MLKLNYMEDCGLPFLCLIPSWELMRVSEWLFWELTAPPDHSGAFTLEWLIPPTHCRYNISLNTLTPRQNGLHFTDDIFKCIFLNENVWIAIRISLTFVSEGPINNIPALVQIMAWRWPGDKPLSGPMMVKLPTHTVKPLTSSHPKCCVKVASQKGWPLMRGGHCAIIGTHVLVCVGRYAWFCVM